MLSHMTFARNLRFSHCRTASSRPQDRLPVEVVPVPHPPLPQGPGKVVAHAARSRLMGRSVSRA